MSPDPFVHGLAAGVLVGATVLTGVGARRRRLAVRLLDRLAAHRPGPPDSGAQRWTASPVAPPAWLGRRLADAAPGRRPEVLFTGWSIAAACVVLAGGLSGGPGLAACAVLVVVAAPALVLGWRRGTADRVTEAGLPDALEAIARALRSGAGSHQALAEAAASTTGPLGHDLDVVVRGLRTGAGLEEVLGDLEHRRPLPGIRLAVAALLLGAEAGGAHARALDGVAASVRARLGVAAEVRALSSQTRLSAVVIACAPVGFAGLAMGTDSASATFLLRTPLGLACLALGLGLDALGAWWMHRLSQVEA